MSKVLKDRIDALEHRILGVTPPPPSPEVAVSEKIMAEWGDAWDSLPDERIEDAISDLVKRLRENPVTVSFGDAVERYRGVLIDCIRAPQTLTPEEGPEK